MNSHILSKTNGAVDKKGFSFLNISIEYMFAFLLAICPILQNYKGFLVDARASVYILCLPYFLYKFWTKNRVEWLLVAPLMLFSMYKALYGGFNFVRLCREGLFCFFILAALNNLIDFKKFKKVIIGIALIASFLIFLQYICYYIFDFHLKLVPTSLFLKNAEQWIGMAETGRISIKGNWMSIYRPSSFFLEPAHMAIYCIPSVALLLLSPNATKFNIIAAAIITFGVFASTSGLGIIICLGFWFLFFALYFRSDSDKNEISIWKLKIKRITLKDLKVKSFSIGKFKTKSFIVKGHSFGPYNILFIGLLVISVIVLYCTVDVFRSSINRILISNGGYNAIAGRTEAGLKAISRLNAFEWIFGRTAETIESTWYMSAFHSTIYDYGLIGFVLSYIFYVRSIFNLKRQYFWIAVMITGLSYFSIHTHGSSYMLFYCMILLSGYFANGAIKETKFAFQIHPLRRLKNKE